MVSKELCIKEHSFNGSRQKKILIFFFCAITKLMYKVPKFGCSPRLIKARKAELRTLLKTVT